jgi:hypothetical protein
LEAHWARCATRALCQDRQKHADQDGNDADHDEQFHQGKSGATGQNGGASHDLAKAAAGEISLKHREIDYSTIKIIAVRKSAPHNELADEVL